MAADRSLAVPRNILGSTCPRTDRGRSNSRSACPCSSRHSNDRSNLSTTNDRKNSISRMKYTR